MVNSFKILKMLFQKILNNDIIYIISKYYGKKWSVSFPILKQIKIKQSKTKKHRQIVHYYYNS